MKIYDLKRGGGKSTRMLYASEYTNAPIICATNLAKDNLRARAKELGLNIPEPITVGEIGNSKTALYAPNVLVDELPLVLQGLLNRYLSCDIIGATLTSDEVDRPTFVLAHSKEDEGGLYDRS